MNKRQLKKGFIQLRHFVLFVVSANYSTTKAETINISPLSVIIHLSSSKAQGARPRSGESTGAWGMPPRLLALAVLALLGLISVNAAASLAHGEQVNKGQIPFRSFPDPEQWPRGGTPERDGLRAWRTRVRGCAGWVRHEHGACAWGTRLVIQARWVCCARGRPAHHPQRGTCENASADASKGKGEAGSGASESLAQ